MRTPLSFDKDTAILLASCCELTYEQYKQMAFSKYQMVFNMYRISARKAIQTTEWFGFILESEDTIIVAFRGTQTDPDWIIDSLVNQKPYPYALNGGNVHNGFLYL